MYMTALNEVMLELKGYDAVKAHNGYEGLQHHRNRCSPSLPFPWLEKEQKP
jgi:hypothetical protein